MGLPLSGTALVLGGVAGVGVLWMTSRLYADATGRGPSNEGTKKSAIGWALAPLIVVARPTWPYHSMTGMETAFFALLLLVGLVFAMRPGRGHALRAGAMFGLAAMTRPEGVGYVVLVIVALLLVRESRRDALWGALAFAIVFVPFFGWRWRYFGYPMPNTYYAKASLSWSLIVRGLKYVEQFLVAKLFILDLAAVLFLMVRDWATSRAWRLSGFIVLGAIANVVLVGGDTFAFHRFFLPALPIGAVALIEATRRVVEERKWISAQRASTVGPIAWLTFCGLTALTTQFVRPISFTTPSGTLSDREKLKMIDRIVADFIVVGHWLKAHYPPDTLIATNAAGIVPFISELPTIDMLGLNDVHIAHVPIELGHGIPGHEKSDPDYVLSRKPKLILVGVPALANGRLNREEIHRWLEQFVPDLPGDARLLVHPEVELWYTLRALNVDGKSLVVLERRDTPRQLTRRE